MRDLLIAGNWKMNGGVQDAENLLQELTERRKNVPQNTEVLVCPPFISLTIAVRILKETDIQLGAQNVHFEGNGAFTGEISTQMLAEIGCTHVIIGHSERREYFGETDEIVNAKLKRVFSAGLKPIVCVGETLEQREEERHKTVVKHQVDSALNGVEEEVFQQIVFAYEPIWAIGTGETATPEQAQEMHTIIRETIAMSYNQKTAETVRVLYGGSMKPGNAHDLLQQRDIDGGLIGGASLNADSFDEIIEIAGHINSKSE